MSTTTIGTIKLNGAFYTIEELGSPKLNVKKNDLYYQMIPEDKVEYSKIQENEIEIHKIVERKSFYTIGIISGRVASLQKFFLYTPLLPTNVNLSLPFLKTNYPKLAIGDRCIIRVSKDNVEMIKNYGNIKLREKDDEIISELYEESFLFPLPEYEKIGLEKKQENGFYTKGFQDLRELNSFNIDPVHSRDFDDAVSIDIEKKKFYIHIVDIQQLEPLSSVDKRGLWLGYTLYLPNQNYPMLPRELAEDAFSLLKGEDRNVITVEIDIEEERDDDKNIPKVKGFEIYPSVIRIKERYHYGNVFENENKEIEYLKKITEMCYKRKLSVPQAKYVLDGDGNTLQIRLEDHSEINHLMVEMLMVMTNHLVTEHLNKELSNVEGFEVKKIPERYHQRVLEDLYEEVTDDIQINHLLVIQKYRSAFYDETLSSHHGLSLDHYTHFTSPIRRYFDVIVHRILAGYDYQNIGEILDHLNERELWNESLSRLYQQWKLMNYIENHSQIYTSYVIKVNKASVKIYIKELGYDVMIHVTNILSNVYWVYDEEENKLKGGNMEIGRGDKVEVQCTKIDYMKREGIQWRIINI